MSARGRGGGGQATAGGVDFQALLAASLTVGMLAESEYEPPWGWPRSVAIEAVRMETGEDVDDISVLTSVSGRAYVQAKRSLSLEVASNSDLGKSLRQFANQYISCRDGVDGRAPLDPVEDRLVLAVGTEASAPVREHLAELLDRLRNWPRDRLLTRAPSNKDEGRALRITIDHVTQAFAQRTGVQPTDDDLRRMLALVRVITYDFGDGAYSEREALNLLRGAVLADPSRAGDAWNALCRAATRDAADQSGMDRRAAQEVLRREGIQIRAAWSYRGDIEQLRALGGETLDSLERLSDISLRAGSVKIARDIPDELERLLTQASCLLVGDPGAGKSATMYEVGHRLRQAGADVVALAADRLEAGSLGMLRGELNLQRDIVQVLANWPSERGVLLIDALDAARGDRTQQALLDLIEATRRNAPHWKIVASIRRFDLRHNNRLRALFPPPAMPPSGFVDPEFASVAHLNVTLLSSAELAQLEHLAPDVHRFLERATPEVRELVRVPFSLRLLAELVDADVAPSELHPIRTQLDLLNVYWEHRVLTPSQRADLRESLLRRVCELIIGSRSMWVRRAALQDKTSLLPVLHELLSAQLLVESRTASGAAHRDALGFAHHVLFDYAAARLLLRCSVQGVIDQLVANPDLPVLIRPSLDLHFQWLWDSDPKHREFWGLTLAIAGRPDIAAIATLAGTTIAAEMAETLDDLEPMIDAVASEDPTEQEIGERTLGHVLAAVQAFDLPLVGEEAGPWAALVARVSDA